MKTLRIAVDFDGTIATERYPKIGVLRNRSKEFINKWYELGHTIIINTCRSGIAEYNAKRFLKKHGIKYHYLNENDPILIKQYGIDCRKISADIYIDDKDSRQLVNWDFENHRVNELANKKPLIIAIVGKSGSGKTTWAEYIESEFGIVMIESHTDRPRRSPNETGHTFHTKEEFDTFDKKDMIAYTEFGDKRYCCLKSDLRNTNTYVIDEAGLDKLDREAYDVITVRMHCSKKKLNKRIGKERAARDKNKFSWFMPWMLWFSRYDYCVNTGKSEFKCRQHINKVIRQIYADY